MACVLFSLQGCKNFPSFSLSCFLAVCLYPPQYRAVEIDLLNIQGVAQLEITLPVLLNGRGIIMAGSHKKYLQGEILVSLVCLF